MKTVQKSIFQWYCKLSFFWFGTYLFLVLLTTNTLCANGLTLDEVLKLGMQANPEISSLEERIEAARGAVVQAGTAPNPDANIKVEDYSPGNGTAKTTVGFTQRLEYPGKRSTRKSIASENVEILKLTLESSKLEIIYKLKKAFYDILQEALFLAGKTRMRPVLMAAITSIVGVVPLAIGMGASSEIQQPMAIVLIGGLITSTLIILVVLPTAYKLMNRFVSGWC